MSISIENIIEAVKTAEKSTELLGNRQLTKVLTGFSGIKMIRLLQELTQLYTQEENAVYLEVGVFQGMTLLSSASASNLLCYGIDNFNFFDPKQQNREIIEERRVKLGIENAHLINLDYEDALENLPTHMGADKKVGVYFIDDPHDYRSQLMCLQLILPHLAENAVIVIDDCNYQHVRQANRDFLATNLGFKLLFEAYTNCHPMNMTSAQKAEATEGFWDGVNVIVRDKDNLLPKKFPPTERNRTVFENDHLVHSAQVRHGAVHALNFLTSLLKFNLKKALVEFGRFWKVYRNKGQQGAFMHSNTFSENLPKSHLVQ